MDERQREQETRWRATIAGLVEIRSCVPDHEVLKPRYIIGVDRAWKIRLATGEIGWAYAFGIYGHKSPRYYLPSAVALECMLAMALSQRRTPEWARSEAVAGAEQKELAKAILYASPERQLKLRYDIIAAERFQRDSKTPET